MTEETENTGAAPEAAADTSTAAADTNSTASTETAEGQGQGEAGKTGEESTEGKPEGEAAEETQPEGAPEQYEAFELPEGYVLEGERLEAAHEFAKANNWTQAQAQEGVATYLKFREAEREHERGLWATQSESEFGEKFDGIAKGAQAAIVELEKVRPGITDRLDKTNLGNHPDILYVFNLLGERGKESGMHGLGGDTAASAEQKSEGVRMYEYAEKPQKGSRS